MVYKTKVSNVGIKLVTSTSAALPEILVSNTLINQWEKLTFDFSAHIGGMTYDQLVFFPDFNARPADDIIYFDNIWGGNGSGLGINSNKLDNYLQVYPNPNNGIFTVNVSNIKATSIFVFNTLGEEIYKATCNGNKTVVDLENAANGVYFIQVVTDAGVLNERIVKQ